MDDTRPISRRRLLQSGIIITTVPLAGCVGDDDDEDDEGPTLTPTPTPTPTPDGDQNDNDTDTGPDEEPFGSVVQWTDSFIVEMEFSDPESGVTGTFIGRWHGGNYHQEIEQQGELIELYFVDDEFYMVSGGQCFINPVDDAYPDPGFEDDPDEFDELVDDDLLWSDITEIDGIELYVYEWEEITYYVSVETGRVRFIDTTFGRISYHSWGAVDPIEPPDMDCIEF